MTTKPNEPEGLEPCPFCGSEDVELRESPTEALVACNICGARTGVVFMGAEEAVNAAWKRQVIAAWNRRAPAQPVADAGGVTAGDASKALSGMQG